VNEETLAHWGLLRQKQTADLKTPAHRSLQSRDSQHAHMKVRVIQTAFTSSSNTLQPTGFNETRLIVLSDCTQSSDNTLLTTLFLNNVAVRLFHIRFQSRPGSLRLSVHITMYTEFSKIGKRRDDWGALETKQDQKGSAAQLRTLLGTRRVLIFG